MSRRKDLVRRQAEEDAYYVQQVELQRAIMCREEKKKKSTFEKVLTQLL